MEGNVSAFCVPKYNFNHDQACKGMQVSVTMVSGDEEENRSYI